MKTVLLFAAAGAFFALNFTACSTAHQAGEDVEYVAKKTGHAVGRGMEKTGDAVARGGEKLQQKTSNP